MNVRVGPSPWLTVLVVLMPACGAASESAPPGDQDPGRTVAVRDLSSIETLQDQFDHDEGMTRLVLLISPT
jgi:hypothetical protein